MMNTNSKILPSQDSISCYSPSTLAFCLPAFYLSSFMILVEETFPFPKNTDIFYVMVAKGVTGESPPPRNLPSTNYPWKIVPMKIGVRQFTEGQFTKEQFSQFHSKGSCISRLNFLPLKTELLHGGMHTHLKGLVGFNLLFLFYSQQKKDSLNMSNLFYHLTFQPRVKYSNIFKDKKKKKINDH